MSGAPTTERTRYDYRHWPAVRAMLLAHPHWVASDGELLTAMNLRPAAANLVEFGPAALARLESAKAAERTLREQIEALALANYVAQTASQEAVVDVLGARNNADLAARVHATACARFGLAAGALCVEHIAAPAGWRLLPRGFVDLHLAHKDAWFGAPVAVETVFADPAEIRSVALVRMRLWPAPDAPEGHDALLAFGSAEAGGFLAGMGGELVAFLARVVGHTAERWPPLI